MNLITKLKHAYLLDRQVASLASRHVTDLSYPSTRRIRIFWVWREKYGLMTVYIINMVTGSPLDLLELNSNAQHLAIHVDPDFGCITCEKGNYIDRVPSPVSLLKKYVLFITCPETCDIYNFYTSIMWREMLNIFHSQDEICDEELGDILDTVLLLLNSVVKYYETGKTHASTGQAGRGKERA